jgi:hypothetical protein
VVLPWSIVAYGAPLSAVVAVILVTVAVRPWRPAVIVAAGLSAAMGPAAWNAILNAVHASEFFTDAPMAVFPISWQDTGSGVFTLALAALVLGLGPLGAAPGRQVALSALLAGVSALRVDIHLVLRADVDWEPVHHCSGSASPAAAGRSRRPPPPAGTGPREHGRQAARSKRDRLGGQARMHQLIH